MSKNNSGKTQNNVSVNKKPAVKTMPRMMEQERAQFALAKVSDFAEKCPAERQKELRSHVSALPALIRMNGLGQALAFYRMKGKSTEQGQEPKDSSHKILYDLVSDWLCGERDKETGNKTKTAGQIFETPGDVLSGITSGDMFQYMAAQNEALALLEWVKKFANALLKTE